MTEQTRLTSYVLYGLFSAIFFKDYNQGKKPRSNFCRGFLGCLHQSINMLSNFFSVTVKIVIFCWYFCCCPRTHSFYSSLKSAVEPRTNFIMPGHCKKIFPNQSTCTIVAILTIKTKNDQQFAINMRREKAWGASKEDRRLGMVASQFIY